MCYRQQVHQAYCDVDVSGQALTTLIDYELVSDGEWIWNGMDASSG